MNFLSVGQERRGVFEDVLGERCWGRKLAEAVSLGLRLAVVKLGLKREALLF
jgi:hypothetical protein